MVRPEAIRLVSLGVLGDEQNVRKNRMSKRCAGRDKIENHDMGDENGTMVT